MMPLDRGVKGSGKIAMRKAKLLLGIFSFLFSDALDRGAKEAVR